MYIPTFKYKKDIRYTKYTKYKKYSDYMVQEIDKQSIETTINEIGGKWKALILWTLKDRALRFNEIKKILHKITQRTLSKKLRELENDDLISRKVYSEAPIKVEYKLTKKGESVLPLLESLCKWGKEHCEEFNLPCKR